VTRQKPAWAAPSLLADWPIACGRASSARATAGVESDPEPFVLQKTLDDFYASYELNCSISDPYNVPVTLSTLHENIQDAFNRHGVQIMSPHYVLQPRHAPMVPPERWHTAPAEASPTESKGKLP
jgi:small-conductance mechanosensitive channel